LTTPNEYGSFEIKYQIIFKNVSKHLECFNRHGVTIIGGVAPAFQDILAAPDLDTYNFSRLKRITSGGASFPVALYQQLKEKFQVPILEMYGMTENAATLTSNPLHLQKPESVGCALDGMSVRVVNNCGRQLPPEK